MRHELKIKQCYLIHLLEGKKTFEIRKNDRDFQVGDDIHFLPLEDENYNVYNTCGSFPRFEITYVHTDLGMDEGYVALAVKPCEPKAI